ncbi:hypothetical protein NE865_01953 [Phthorimaea operculella]|nr:hypothetical protein NE865_01953 [Phthorimaea operculella]
MVRTAFTKAGEETLGFASAVAEEIAHRKWSWIGHTLRRSDDNLAKIAFEWLPSGKRRRGRPVETWRRITRSELNAVGASWDQAKTTAQNREEWKKLSRALCTSGVP